MGEKCSFQLLSNYQKLWQLCMLNVSIQTYPAVICAVLTSTGYMCSPLRVMSSENTASCALSILWLHGDAVQTLFRGLICCWCGRIDEPSLFSSNTCHHAFPVHRERSVKTCFSCILADRIYFLQQRKMCFDHHPPTKCCFLMIVWTTAPALAPRFWHVFVSVRSPSFPLIQDTVLKGKLSVPELRVTRLMNRSISCTMKNPKGELFSYPPNSQVRIIHFGLNYIFSFFHPLALIFTFFGAWL